MHALKMHSGCKWVQYNGHENMWVNMYRPRQMKYAYLSCILDVITGFPSYYSIAIMHSYYIISSYVNLLDSFSNYNIYIYIYMCLLFVSPEKNICCEFLIRTWMPLYKISIPHSSVFMPAFAVIYIYFIPLLFMAIFCRHNNSFTS